mmetsp:Transcript_1819/g.2341  ORF Transcript_1819/g.2341 Transcript_1819/m.2341 type:complete len:116 (+) Transcript_1819:218-565(+)
MVVSGLMNTARKGCCYSTGSVRAFTTSTPNRAAVLSLYKDLLRAGNGFSDYNLRSYINRRVKTDFRKNQSISSDEKIAELYEFGQDQLQMAKRQAVISQLYKGQTSVMENLSSKV